MLDGPAYPPTPEASQGRDHELSNVRYLTYVTRYFFFQSPYTKCLLVQCREI